MFFGLIKSKTVDALGKAAKAKDAQIAEKIEDANIVEFAKQDVEKIQTNLSTVRTNIGKLKGRIQTLTDDKAENDRQIADHTDWCRATREAGRPTLPSTLARERQINPFLRCAEPAVIAAARSHGARGDSGVEVFGALREWKNHYR